MNVAIVVPIAAFLFVLGIIGIIAYSGHRKRTVAHETLRLLIEKGEPLSSEMINDMSMLTDPRRNDLRRGVILLSLALAFCLIGMIHVGNGDGEAFVIAVFPGTIGLAFLALWKFGYDSKAD